MIRKTSILVLLLGFVLTTPVFAQKFSKKEQAKQEARSKNYFHGASFTFTTGYVHSWMVDGDVTPSSTATFGTSSAFKNTHDSFNLGFLWDQSFSKYWGMQNGLYYVQKGGEKHAYYDGGLGYGKMLRSVESLSINALEWQGMARYFIPLTHTSRISVNGGLYVTNMLNEKSAGVRNWNLGVMCGLGYDYKHLAFSVNYQPGLFPKVCDDSDTRMNAFAINIGYRFWSK